jgi:hypothetical protein
MLDSAPLEVNRVWLDEIALRDDCTPFKRDDGAFFMKGVDTSILYVWDIKDDIVLDVT